MHLPPLLSVDIYNFIQRRVHFMAKELGETCSHLIDYEYLEKLQPDEKKEYLQSCHELMVTISADYKICKVKCVPCDFRSAEKCDCQFPKTQEEFLKEFMKSMDLEIK